MAKLPAKQKSLKYESQFFLKLFDIYISAYLPCICKYLHVYSNENVKILFFIFIECNIIKNEDIKMLWLH